eukprot:gene11242-11391_t
MDWSNVTGEELIDALREVEWLAPRPIWEFLSKFNIPKNQSKWSSRLKCNVYYYRTNYLFLLTTCLVAAFFRKPLSLLAAFLALIALLTFNDPFTNSLKTSRQRSSNVRVLGLQRPLFVLLMLAAALYGWYRSRGWLMLLTAVVAGVSLPLGHASLRSPNLKARLASAREEFRAV